MESFRTFVQKTPFFRIFVPFAIGIATQDYLQYDLSTIGLWICLFLLVVLILSSFHQTPVNNTPFGVCSLLFLFIVGFWWGAEYHRIHRPSSYNSNSIICCRLDETPQERAKTYRAQATLKWVQETGKNISSDETVILYFKKGNHQDTAADSFQQPATPDRTIQKHRAGNRQSVPGPIMMSDKTNKEGQTTDSLQAGSILLFKNKLEEIRDHGNPFEFSYQNYMNRQNIYRQAFLNPEEWKLLSGKERSLLIATERLRQQLIESFKRSGLEGRNLAVLSALTIGYKQDLDSEMKKAFISAGTMHLLAVSGMHVVAIYGFFKYLLFFLNKNRKTLLIRNSIVFIAVWLFALLAGMAPSILRAAVMITFLLIAEIANRNCNIYNSLAASAFLLIAYNPNNLFDASFQLSYMAVIGIVYYHPQINNWLSPKNGVLKWLWATISISLAAQLGTFPIILKDFNQFPNYFLLSNILSIPLSFILMGLSLLLPLSLLWSNLNHLTSQTTAFFLDIFNRSTIWFEHLPGAVTQGFHPSSISVAILYALPLLFFLWLKEKKAGYLLGIISLSIILSSFSLYDLIQAEQQNRIIIYNNPDQLTIHLIHGRQSDLIIWDSSVKKTSNINYLTQPVENKYNLHKTQLHWVGQYTSSGIAFSKNFLYFNGKILYNPYKQSDEVRKRPRCNVDYVFLNRIFNKKELEDLKQTFPESEFLVTDRSVSKYMKKKTLILLDLNYISIPDSGALEIDLNRGIEKHDLQKERYVSFLAKK